MDSLKDRLIAARAAKGWSQTKLAQKAGVSQGTIGNLEAGIRGPGASLVKIAAALDVSVQWLMDGEGSMTATGWPFPMVDRARYERLSPEDKAFVQGQMMQAVRERERAASEEDGGPVQVKFGNSAPAPARRVTKRTSG